MKASRVLLTGTTSGVGRALLEHYVAAGSQVVAVNRRRVAELEARYPSVRFECVDVREPEAVASLITNLVATEEVPDLFVLNAGINRVDNDESFQLAAYREVLDTNLYGVINFVQPLTLLPVRKEPRRVVAVSSMANYVGNPYGLGYHTSKRAVTACFQAWSRMYSGTDLVFQQVMLGPVRTPIHTMASKFPRWMVRINQAFSVSVEDAAQAIADLARTDKRRLFYPARAVPLYTGMWLGQSFIPGFFQGRKTLAGRSRRRDG